MPNTLKKQVGTATIAGTTIFTVPAGAIITIIGLRASNTDNTAEHWVTVELAGTNVSSVETPLPIGGAYEFTDGSKFVAEDGDTVVAYADTDTDVQLYISYLEQS